MKFILSTILLSLTLGASAGHAQQADVSGATTEIIESEGADVSARFRFANGCLITRVSVSARVSFKDDSGLFGPGVGVLSSTIMIQR